MSRDIFSSWFFDDLVPFVAKELEEKNLPAKAILFADNCSAHGSFFATKHYVYFTTKGCLQNLKTNYRKRLIAFVVKELAMQKKIPEVLRNVSMPYVIFWLAESWDMVTRSTITKSWESFWPDIQTSENLSTDNLIEQTLTSNQDIVDEFQRALNNEDSGNPVDDISINTWLNCLTVQHQDECLTAQVIVDSLKPKENSHIEHNSEKNWCDKQTDFWLATDSANQTLRLLRF
ncbi:hypothetical protein HCN44_008836 [Aphidius gifuensis]|uniref:DDE-1 domain-containing protein n=1 Tax=Aphidius gifuensis TaxID=684658 RepID=A0A834Y1T5_APHGI|nr:hypothetical protein HCN44_008836 [Aphidius gifuensis]